MSEKLKCKDWREGDTDYQPRYAQAKYDGMWLEARWPDPQASGDVKAKLTGRFSETQARLITSRPTDITAQLDWCEWYAPLVLTDAQYHGMPRRVYGELWVPGEPASYVKTAIKRKDERLQFTPFAAEGILGCMHAEAPLEPVETTMWDKFALRTAPFFALNQLGYVVTPAQFTLMFSRSPQWEHAEGVIFKDGNLTGWRKWKPVRTCDCVVTGTVDGEGKYLGLVGSLTCSVWSGGDPPDGDGFAVGAALVPVANVSGMTDLERADMSLDDELIGRVVEVEYQYVGSGGRLRHPRFKRFRDDKQPHECTEDQLR